MSELLNILTDDPESWSPMHQVVLFLLILLLITLLLTTLILVFVIRSIRSNRNTEKELIAARERAESAARLKEQFLTNMSHEIRTPLNAILGYSTFLQRTDLVGRQVEFVDGIRSAGQILLALLNDILDLSKLEADMLRFEPLPFYLEGLLHSVEQMFQLQAREKGVDLQLQPLPTLPPILIGDPTRLTQMLINLIGNAVKFTPEGRIDVWVTTLSQTDDQLRLLFKVQDTGIGIPAEKLDMIFERFEQASGATAREYGGTGLGLSIVKKLAELQGGRIYAESQVGQGTTFFLEMPFQIAAPGVLPRAQAKEVPLEQIRATLHKLHVLVVEDNPMNQHIASLMLKRMGPTFEIAANGAEALDLLQKQSFDLVLMDLQMPVLDGYQTAQRIRNELGLHLPIIAMTAHVLAGERERCLSFGMNDYLSKPIREQELFRLISHHVRPNQPLADPGGPTSGPALYLDQHYLQEISGGDPAALAELADIFLQQAPHELAQLDEHLTAGRYKLVARTAHSMKSTVAYMGMADTLGKLLELLEAAAQQQPPDPDHIQRLFSQVNDMTQDALHLVRETI